MLNRKKNRKNSKKSESKEKKLGSFSLPEEVKKGIGGIIILLIAIIIALSFFELAGIAGKALRTGLAFLIGKTIFFLPLILVISGLVFFSTKYKKFFYPLLLAILISIVGISGIIESFSQKAKSGGWLGYLIVSSFSKLFGILVTQIIFGAVIVVGFLIFWQLIKTSNLFQAKEKVEEAPSGVLTKPSFIKKIFTPSFKVKEIEKTPFQEIKVATPSFPELKTREIESKTLFPYQSPPLDFLETEKGLPGAGDVRINAAIIKKTLENFDIPVEMAEINIGPTVTQYTLKPAEGVKLSKITALSNDLALALASHPLRIEAPIPGKSLVGIEVPNKVRAQVRLRNLMENSIFQKSPSHLTIVLGKDVSGNPVYTDLGRMPHLLVAGSTGTGKTIFLNNLILSLIFRNSPEILRFILIDPKRVEFPIYNELPHLLAPVIYDATKTVNALKWLIGEMERRFDVLSEAKARDIIIYNKEMIEKGEIMPYIVLIVDELADLMAAKGKEVEVGIVRLAQMARAVGIHLVVATQRPSVEVITGLIKANITSRITFQVASQVDSRTVLDMAGAEKLLGLGDLLYLSAEIGKPKRIQASYVSEKEVRKVVNFIKSKSIIETEKITGEIENQLAEDLGKTLELPESELGDFYGGDDPLYEEAKRVVIEARKASASLLQRRLRVGYARAARLIDMLEGRGVVGPGEGAKPRTVFINIEEKENNNNWQKV
jgi:S-DNA-T family DNA segregation ATPase FtsK/SpoIIIE